MKPFAPNDNATSSVSATTSTASSALKRVPTGPFSLRLYNAGAVAVFYRLGGSAVTAAATDVPLAAGATEVITVNSTDKDPLTHIAAITASSTATLYATTGQFGPN